MRRWVGSGAVALVLATTGCSAPALPPSPAPTPAVFHDPTFGMSLQLPPGWHVGLSAGSLQCTGPDGFVNITGIETDDLSYTQADSLDPRFNAESFSVDGHPARVVTPRSGDETARAEVVLPAAIQRPGAPHAEKALLLGGDAKHLDAFVHALHFERDPAAYAHGVLDVLEATHYRRKQVDWAALRQQVDTAIGEAKAPADTAGALNMAIAQLQERHSHYFPATAWADVARPTSQQYGLETLKRAESRWVITRVLPQSPAEQAGLQAGDIVTQAKVDPSAMTLTVVHPGGTAETTVTMNPATLPRTAMPVGRMLADGIAYLEVPTYVELDQTQAYGTTLRRLVSGLAAQHPRAWVLDVRRNGGGLFGAMVPPLTPLLGTGPFNGLETDPGQGTMTVLTDTGDQSQVDLAALPGVPSANPPVAVLTSPLTASAGEFLAMAFNGKPKTRRFGEPTAGEFSQMAGFTLWDGAYLNVAAARALDAAGQAHDGPIAPDEAIENTFVGFGTDADPVLQRAVSWLNPQK